MSERKIAVIAGSPVDTRMGIEVLQKAGMEAYPYPVSQEAREQTEFQMQPLETRTEIVRNIMKQAISDGMDSFMIYCNALSSTIDMEALGEELHVKVVTPLMAYAAFAKQYQVIALLAGNNQACAGIERAIMTSNISATVIGTGLLPMVVAVEEELKPEEIYDKFALGSLFDFFQHAGAEAFILGCTHFPYIRSVLDERVSMPILDPAEEMIRMLSEK